MVDHRSRRQVGVVSALCLIATALALGATGAPADAGDGGAAPPVVSAGGSSTCAVTTNQAAVCWGLNGDGELGNGTTATSRAPVGVTGLGSGVSSIAVGTKHACALTTAGGVKCWGSGLNGRLGNGSTASSSVPVDVTGLSSGVTAITAGVNHTCARLASGALKCWGANNRGQLGDNSLTTSSTPVDVSGMSSGVAAVSAGGAFTCARTDAGAAMCWGANGSGQLGNNTKTSSSIPVPVSGLASGVASLSTGAGHTCATTTLDAVLCWGDNASGELGDGSVTLAKVPVGVFGLSTGLLRVTTTPAVPSQITIDGHIADSWGLVWLKVAVGDHEVCFGDIAGFTTPACRNAVVRVGQTTTVNGDFVLRGYLRVVTSPAVPSQITVDGHPRNNWGMWTDLPVGAHQVCFGAVAGYTPPACQDVEVTAGTTTTATGTFTESSGEALAGVGFLRITTDPPIPTQISVDGFPADTWGLSWLELPPGPHAVCFSRVEGYDQAPCADLEVTAGATTSFTPTMALRGFLAIQTSPPVPATITLDGIAVDDWGNFTDRPPGTTKVCFGFVPGKVTPPCQDVVVLAGQLVTVTGTYS